ncbi:MAG: dTDP-4-dehydrorhamnose 3,5-epimerase family protein [Bifidobacteriaceae bacterium]|jgi:dTDP-4-dehydrorhamnose 3,5-epimerase|nr:dTDP-4-dehydrorhamnose 3,5-epimerase family protein [Bifidobacteriaceae bacterium]
MAELLGPYDPVLYRNRELVSTPTSIPGLVVVDLVVHQDGRGWWKETFDAAHLEDIGLPAGFVPHRWCSNASKKAGVTRGIHAELANKYVTLERGEILAVIVDLRRGEGFGGYERIHLTVGRGLLIPVGCGNSYQTLTDDVHYAYLTDQNIAPTRPVTRVSLADPALAIAWPIPLEEATVLDEDRWNPTLSQVEPLDLAALANQANDHTYDRS